VNTLPTPATRCELISAITEACELEHGLACSYLYAAFSLKRRVSEGGLTADQLHKATLWAAQIFFVASQEMLHLAQAWNLLGAIGGTPYCLRPNLPQNSRYYPLRARIALEPFGEKSLKRFIVYETPAKAELPWVCRQAKFSKTEIDRGHVSIGELYGSIANGFTSIKDLFAGDPANQVDRKSIQFPDIVQVNDTASALRGIHMITSQGEGTVADRVDCHYGVFLGILKDFRQEQASAGEIFQPVRPVMENPVADTTRGYGAAAHPIKEPLTRNTAELFDAVYLLMLQSLAFAFTPSADPGRSARAAAAALELMTAVIRVLGDALTTLPSGVNGFSAGPAFGLTRFIGLPTDPKIAISLIRERLGELATNASVLAQALPATPQLGVAAARLTDIAARCLP
jgi:Ferritin-like